MLTSTCQSCVPFPQAGYVTFMPCAAEFTAPADVTFLCEAEVHRVSYSAVNLGSKSSTFYVFMPGFMLRNITFFVLIHITTLSYPSRSNARFVLSLLACWVQFILILTVVLSLCLSHI